MNDSGDNWNIVGTIVVLAIIYFIAKAFFGFSLGKYEGLTAEEWFDEYDAAVAEQYYEGRTAEEWYYEYEEASEEVEDCQDKFQRFLNKLEDDYICYER